MTSRNIDIIELFKQSFSIYKWHASFVFGVMCIYFVLGMIPQIYIFLTRAAQPTFQSQLISFIFLLIQLFLALGFTKVMLFLVEDRPVEVTDMFNNIEIFLSYIAAYFLYIIAVIIGLFLFILPGIYVAIRLMFYPYYIIEHGDHSFKALQKSYYATEGFNFTLQLFLFGICWLVINFLGALLFGIGILFTYPLTTLAVANIFVGLKHNETQIPNDFWAE